MTPPPKSFSCEVCNELFDMKMQLIKHRKVHKVAKPYQCTFCEKCFQSKLAREHHIRIHTGEKPYTCQVSHSEFLKEKLFYNQDCASLLQCVGDWWVNELSDFEGFFSKLAMILVC